MVRNSAAIPGTGRRTVSWRTKVFQAASRGRGSAVTMTVSSMSLTRPSAWSAPTTCMTVPAG